MATFDSHAPGTPCWLDLSVDTAEQREALIAFYTTLFGWSFDVGGPETGFYSTARQHGHAVLAIGEQPGGQGVYVVYFGTNDIAASLAQARDLGGTPIMGPMRVMEFGSMGLVLDPAGAVHGLWQPGTMTGFGLMHEPGAPGWFDHASSQPDAAAAYYAGLLGAEVLSPHAGMRILTRGDQWFASITEDPETPPHWTPVIVVDTIAEAAERARAAGAEVLFENMPVPGSAITVLRDPVVGSIINVMAAGDPSQPPM